MGCAECKQLALEYERLIRAHGDYLDDYLAAVAVGDVGKMWEVRIIAITGRFALSVRRIGQTYSNAVVEKHFSISATTRNWNTIESICRILES